MRGHARPHGAEERFGRTAPVSLACATILAVMLGGFWLARIMGLGGGGSPYGIRATAFALVAAGFAVSHAWASRGARFACRFLVVASATSLATEMVGVQTGLVFGAYSYAVGFGPKILGLVPVIIPLIWFAVSYLASVTSDAITGGRAGHPPGGIAPGRAALSAGLLLGYDLVADPNHVFRGGWSYETGGFFHGVPLQNFVAWYAIGLAMFLLLQRGETSDGGTSFASPPWHVATGALAYVGIVAHESVFAFCVAGHIWAGTVGAALVTVTSVLLARTLVAVRGWGG